MAILLRASILILLQAVIDIPLRKFLPERNPACGVNFFFFPLQGTQTLDDAENLVGKQIELLKDGEFDDAFFNAVKLTMIRQHEENIESMEGRLFNLIGTYIEDSSWEDLLSQPEKLNSISKEQVVKIANKTIWIEKANHGPQKDIPKTTPVIYAIGKNTSHILSTSAIPGNFTSPAAVSAKNIIIPNASKNCSIPTNCNAGIPRSYNSAGTLNADIIDAGNKINNAPIVPIEKNTI